MALQPSPSWLGHHIRRDRPRPLASSRRARKPTSSWSSAHRPDHGASCLLAHKRYRSAQHRLFHRDAGYLEGRRVRRIRDDAGDGDTHRLRPGGHRDPVGGGRVRRPRRDSWNDGRARCPIRSSPATRACCSSSSATPAVRPLRARRAAPRPRRARRPVRAVPVGDAGDGGRRPHPRRPVRLQPARPPGPARGDRPAPGGRHRRQPAGRRIPASRLPQHLRLVHAAVTASHDGPRTSRPNRDRCEPSTTSAAIWSPCVSLSDLVTHVLDIENESDQITIETESDQIAAGDQVRATSRSS